MFIPFPQWSNLSVCRLCRRPIKLPLNTITIHYNNNSYPILSKWTTVGLLVTSTNLSKCGRFNNSIMWADDSFWTVVACYGNYSVGLWICSEEFREWPKCLQCGGRYISIFIPVDNSFRCSSRVVGWEEGVWENIYLNVAVFQRVDGYIVLTLIILSTTVVNGLMMTVWTVQLLSQLIAATLPDWQTTSCFCTYICVRLKYT